MKYHETCNGLLVCTYASYWVIVGLKPCWHENDFCVWIVLTTLGDAKKTLVVIERS